MGGGGYSEDCYLCQQCSSSCFVRVLYTTGLQEVQEVEKGSMNNMAITLLVCLLTCIYPGKVVGAHMLFRSKARSICQLPAPQASSPACLWIVGEKLEYLEENHMGVGWTCKLCTERPGSEPRTIFLWGDSAIHCITVPLMLMHLLMELSSQAFG